MNSFTVSSALVFLSCLSMFILILLKGKKQPTNMLWGIFCLVVAIWGLAGFKISMITDKEAAIFWWKIALISVLFTPAIYAHFIFSFFKEKRNLLLIGFYVPVLFLAILAFWDFKLYAGEPVFVFNKYFYVNYFKEGKILFILFYIVYYWLILGYMFLYLIKKFIKSSGLLKMQCKYLIATSIFGWLGAEGCFAPALINLPPHANFLMAVFPLIQSYAIIKYRLFDIKVALTRTGIFIAVYTIILGVPFFIVHSYKSILVETFKDNAVLVPLLFMALLATTGPYLYAYFQKKAEERLLKEQNRYQQSLKNAAIGMTRIRDLNKLLKLIAYIVTKNVKISFAAIYLCDEAKEKFVLHALRGKGKRAQHPLTIEDNQALIRMLDRKNHILVYEEIKQLLSENESEDLKKIEETMWILDGSLIVSCHFEDKMLGFIVLGEKLSGLIYSEADISVFQSLASQAAVAIKNAQFYEQLKEMNEQIAQTEKMVTVGTMADGLSHQINNRFYALSLIAGDTLDTIKMTDASGFPAEAVETLKQINFALERIQANVVQGGEVVKGLLKYTRKGNEGMEQLTIDRILDGTLGMLKYKIKLDEIDMIRQIPQDLPSFTANYVQMQEVLFNLIDNAFEAIVERRKTLKEQDYKGRIIISASCLDHHIKISLQDNGIGIKKEDARKLFTPFFTTKTAEIVRKGTGLGLFVIKNIVVDTHKGKIEFQSDYKIGTNFILSLPIYQ